MASFRLASVASSMARLGLTLSAKHLRDPSKLLTFDALISVLNWSTLPFAAAALIFLNDRKLLMGRILLMGAGVEVYDEPPVILATSASRRLLTSKRVCPAVVGCRCRTGRDSTTSVARATSEWVRSPSAPSGNTAASVSRGASERVNKGISAATSAKLNTTRVLVDEIDDLVNVAR